MVISRKALFSPRIAEIHRTSQFHRNFRISTKLHCIRSSSGTRNCTKVARNATQPECVPCQLAQNLVWLCRGRQALLRALQGLATVSAAMEELTLQRWAPQGSPREFHVDDIVTAQQLCGSIPLLQDYMLFSNFKDS